MDKSPGAYNPVSGTSVDNSSETTTSVDDREGNTSEHTDTVSSLSSGNQQGRLQRDHQNREISCKSSSHVPNSKKVKKRRHEKNVSYMTKKQKINKSPKAWIEEQHEDERMGDTKDEKLDLTTVEGQMAAKKGLSHTMAKDEAKREYNRRNSARARARNKVMVTELQKQVAELTRRIEMQEKEKSILVAQLELLSKQGLGFQNLRMFEPPAPHGLPHQLQLLVPPAPGSGFSPGLAQQLCELLAHLQQVPVPAPAPSRGCAESAVNLLSQLSTIMQQQQQQQQQQDLKPNEQYPLSQLIMSSNQPPNLQLPPASTEERDQSDMMRLLRTMSPQEIYAMLRERDRR